LSENAAVTIGRIGLVCPAPIAPHLEHFAKQWYVRNAIAWQQSLSDMQILF
jgi:hypothetical protein